MIVECLVTTLDESGELNVAPMGPRFDDCFDWQKPVGGTFKLCPFEPSRTLDNLRSVRAGVLNFTDNVLMLAQMALKAEEVQWPDSHQARKIRGRHLTDAGRCWEFEVESVTANGPRWQCNCRVVHAVEQRPLLVFNRAMHAVIEATILATRIGILPDDQIRAQIATLSPLIEKTAGPEQLAAWNWVCRWVDQRLPLKPDALSSEALISAKANER
ncbi:MAG: DUF447 family protein [Pirellulaceae bacterium]|nr:DUF447 family protein [Pirellulaceae bacterium]